MEKYHKKPIPPSTFYLNCAQQHSFSSHQICSCVHITLFFLYEYHVQNVAYVFDILRGSTVMWHRVSGYTVYPKKYAHGFWFAVLCCGYALTDLPISIRLTLLALLQSNDCPSASKATLMNMDKYFMWIHYERLHNHNKAKHNKTVCIFLGIYCMHISHIKRPGVKLP